MKFIKIQLILSIILVINCNKTVRFEYDHSQMFNNAEVGIFVKIYSNMYSISLSNRSSIIYIVNDKFKLGPNYFIEEKPIPYQLIITLLNETGKSYYFKKSI